MTTSSAPEQGAPGTTARADPERVLGSYLLGSISVLAYDQVGSMSAQWVAWELMRDDYGLDRLELADGDVVIDIGAHVGLFSMYVAKRWPKVTVLAFEPFPANHRNCVDNLLINAVTNVSLQRRAISADGRSLTMAVDPGNSGGASALVQSFRARSTVEGIPSTTLDDVFATGAIDRCRLLKIDCEGMEYEILTQTRMLHRVDQLVGEFHASPRLARQGWTPEHLIDHCAAYFGDGRMRVQTNEIPD